MRPSIIYVVSLISAITSGAVAGLFTAGMVLAQGGFILAILAGLLMACAAMALCYVIAPAICDAAQIVIDAAESR